MCTKHQLIMRVVVWQHQLVDATNLCVRVLFFDHPFLMNSFRHIATSIDMKHKPIDEALREFQTLFRMPVSCS